MNKWFKIITAIALAVMVIATITPAYASAYSNSGAVKQAQSAKVLKPLPSKGGEQPQIWLSIGKKAVVFAIRHGGFALSNLIKKIPYSWAQKSSKSIAKYGNKAANVIEEINGFTETSVTLGLVKAGIPPADARNIAKFVCFFL